MPPACLFLLSNASNIWLSFSKSQLFISNSESQSDVAHSSAYCLIHIFAGGFVCLMMELQIINSQCSAPSLESEQKCSLWLQSEGSEINLIDCVWLDTRFYLTSVCPSVSLDVCVHVLQVALCFSPVGSKLRVRSRKFPAVVNCTAINWFHEWPQEALESVSFRFLEEVENINVRTVHNLIQWGEATHLNDFHTLMI